MTTTDTITIPWSSLLDLWEEQDPIAVDYFCSFHSMHQLKDEGLSPYERLIQIHKTKEDTNNEFFDSLVTAAASAFKAEQVKRDFDGDFFEYSKAILDNPGNHANEEYEIDFCEEGVLVGLFKHSN